MGTPTKRIARQLTFPEPYRVHFVEGELSASGPRQILARTVLSEISHDTETVAYTRSGPFHDQILTAERRFVARPPDQPFYPYRHARYDTVGVVEAVGTDERDVRLGERVWTPVGHQTAFVTGDSLRLPDSVSDEDAVVINLPQSGWSRSTMPRSIWATPSRGSAVARWVNWWCNTRSGEG